MLTADLVRTSVRKGVVVPQYIDADDPRWIARANTLCALFGGAVGRRRAELDEDLADLVGDDADFAITRGLAKLLDDRSTWEIVAPMDPSELRTLLFEAAAEHHPVRSHRRDPPDPPQGPAASPGQGPGAADAGVPPALRVRAKRVTRADVIGNVADSLGITPQEIEDAIYGDLKSEQRMTAHKAIDPDALLHRYNLALAQGTLFRAMELRIRVRVDRPARLRQIFRYLKFFQLMHRARREATGAWTITIDGPTSVLQSAQRYGLQMAKFLPAVLLLSDWELEADLLWGPKQQPLAFRLTPNDNLVTHLRARGTYISDPERVLYDRINENASAWRARRKAVVLDLGGEDVLVPDFVVECTDTGRVVYIEIVGFWRRSYLERRAAVLSKHGPPNLILCVSRRLATERETVTDDVGVVDFAEVIPLNKVLELAEERAIVPGDPGPLGSDTTADEG